MLMIFASFGLLAYASLRARRLTAEPRADARRAGPNVGYVYGPVSALAYAGGALTRKQGLNALPDPHLGTFVGAACGALAFLGMALVAPSYRRAVRSALSEWNPWLVAAGVMASFGQLLVFEALNTATVSRVALVGSLEVFFTMMLTAWVVRTGEILTRSTIVAAIMSVAGAALVVTS
jgi:uncharacterized membrane protein